MVNLPGAAGTWPAGNADPVRNSQDHLELLVQSALELHGIVDRISPEEFRWQESHYDRDSRYGRELLFLMANHEWVRATSEIVSISRSDSIETTIKIDIDLDQVTHEAFRDRTGRFWLPVTILPPQKWADSAQRAEQRRLEPDPFATVTDAAGNLMPMLPTADVNHQMSAAMAEIIVNMAVARWPGRDRERPTSTRDQRLLLSAAIYRLLRRGLARGRAPDPGARPLASLGAIPADGQTPRTSATRMDRARQELLKLLDSYNTLLSMSAVKSPGRKGRPGPDTPQFAPELAARAVEVLAALAESMVVVVPLDRAAAPTVVTVRVPTRSLHSSNARKLTQPWTWIARPIGHLDIGVLLPTADADRQVQVHLPDGLSFADPPAGDASPDLNRPRLDICVTPLRSLQSFQELKLLVDQLARPGPGRGPTVLRQCLADLARSKATAVDEIFRHYEAGTAEDQPPADKRQQSTTTARATLSELSTGLAVPDDEPDGDDAPDGGDDTALAALKAAQARFEGQTRSVFRRTSADRVSPRTVVARADIIEDVAQRAVPEAATIRVDVAFTDGEFLANPRFSGRMSLLLMIIVLALLVSWRLLRHSIVPSPEVLAIVLTLFSAIQAGQMERPDRSTLRGLLSAGGNWLIGASIFPAVVLAVVLAFPWGGWVPVFWACGCVGGQVLFQLAMSGGPATAATSRLGQRWLFSTDELYYRHFEALRSNYWRSTTADALMIGRTAYAYVVWQKSRPPQLIPLLDFPADGETANVLALLRAGTPGQAATFVVFRKDPGDSFESHADTVSPLDLDPNRLAPMESVTSVVDVFVGIDRAQLLPMQAHPAVKVLGAAKHKLIVLDAQLPVPNPTADHDERLWARVRVALRDAEDIGRLAPFLDGLLSCGRGAPADHRLKLAVRTVPGLTPRIISTLAQAPAGAQAARTARSGSVILASDLDIVNTAASRGEHPGARTWRVLAICADAWSNVESDIVAALAGMQPPMQLAGLTYGLMHGTAVLFVLVHEPDGLAVDRTDIEAKLRRKLSHARLHVPVNEDLTRSELGSAGKHPQLRLHFRWQDRPGALLDVLTALRATLREGQPQIGPDDWSVAYARTQVAAGRSALTRLTVRVHASTAMLASWKSNQMEEISRKVQTRAAQEAAAGRAAGTPPGDDPVINVELIRAPGSDAARPAKPG